MHYLAVGVAIEGYRCNTSNKWIKSPLGLIRRTASVSLFSTKSLIYKDILER